MTSKINWGAFENNNFVEFEEGVTKRLVLTDWKDSSSTFEGTAKPAVEFTVVEEDSKVCVPLKVWKISNYSAIQKLRPIVEEAEASAVGVVVVNVTRVGQNKGTKYAVVKALPIV